MSIPGTLIPLFNSGGGASYSISRSLRFNSADSAYLSRTPASAGNRKTWTWAGWVKRSGLGGDQEIIVAESGSDVTELYFTSDTIWFYQYNGSYQGQLITTQVFRDPSSWYHLVAVYDADNATASDRMRLYINGNRITQFSTSQNLSPGTQSALNSTYSHYIGARGAIGSRYLSGYLADIYFIDGQALTPSSFTETDATTGQLIPKAYTGSYGSQGWHLEFADNSSNTATTLGKDTSGNSPANNWTPNNLSVTAGAGNDSLVDFPSSSGTDTGVGGQVRGNYCTLNPLDKGSNVTLTNGNLDVSTNSTWNSVRATFGITSGKWYWEYTMSAAGYTMVGIGTAAASLAIYIGDSASGYAFYSLNGNKWNSGTAASYGNSFTTNDVVGVAFDADSGKIWFSKNGTWQASGDPAAGTNAAYTSIPSSTYFPTISQDNSLPASTGGTLNAGSRPFAYTAPSGFKALNTANLPAPLVTKPNTVFDTVLYTGTGSTQTISSLQFNPDFLWIKNRDSAGYNHHLTDIVRGVTQRLRSNTTGAELTTTDQVTAYTSTGFTLGADSAGPGNLECNQSSKTYVAWAWDAGSSTVTNTQGSITSTVSVRANATAGFSIVKYAGASGGGSWGHGLGVEPKFIIFKRYTSTQNWFVFHKTTGSWRYFEGLNNTNADSDYSSSMSASSTIVTLPNMTEFNTGVGSSYLAYCFAPVVGYSSFGSYTGTGGGNPFVYLGFRPRWLLVKRSSTSGDNWWVIDSARNTYNVANSLLYPSDSAAETTATTVDFVSNGFVIRSGNSGYADTSGSTYIYAAFAESPFNYARAR